MSFIDVNGTRIHYRIDGPMSGQADSPVLVLSNSLGTDLGMWDAQVSSFARQFRVLRYDSRGHGASAVTPGPYTIERLARDVVGLLDGLGIARAHFCGLSLGGMVGMWLATNAPERIGKLALCNTAALIGPPDIWNARIEAVRKGGMAAISAAVLDRWFTRPYLERATEAVERVRQTLVATPPEGYIACCAAVRDMDQRDALSRVRAPTLVIAGSGDVATPPADGRFLAERIPGARYVELDTAHLSNIEAAERFTETVSKFLAE